MRRTALIALLSLLLALPVGSASAHTVVPPSPPVVTGGPPEIQLRSLQVQATVEQGVAQVTVDQVFVNQASVPAEGTYLFPLPAGATVSSFQMFVDGQAYNAEVLDAAKARDVYESIVRRNRDPAILQYVGQGLLQARVFPVPPGAERKIRIAYSQVLPREGGLAEFSFPLGDQRVPQASITVEVKGLGSGALYSPTHEVAVVRGRDGAARASFEGGSVSGQFRLFLGAADQELDVSLLTFKSSGENGYFLLLANPPAASAAEVAAKDVILVIDLSGSMSGKKFDQAKGAALQVLGALGEDDRFAVVGFHSDAIAYSDNLLGSSQAGSAMEWVKNLALGGSTNISEAMARAQRIAGKDTGRPQVILLITDGQPTVGETNADSIVAQVKKGATPSQRIFTFGVGYDVNTLLLDAMAQDIRGRSDYVKPDENLEAAVAGLWRKVGQPVLTGLDLEWSGVQVEEIYPRPLPDLYLGNQLVILGRYRTGGEGTVTIRGTVNGQTKSYRFPDLKFSSADTSRDYIPRLWATRKVGYLLSEVRLRGADQEKVSELVALAQRYGIVTPYTSFFVNEPGAPTPTPAMSSAKVMTEAAAAPAGQAAVDRASSVAKARDAEQITQPQGPGADQIRTAGDKTFVLRSGVWTDTAYQSGELTHLKVGSDTYLELLRRRPDLGRYFAAGTPLIVVDGTVNWGIDIPGSAESKVELPEAPAATGGRSRPLIWIAALGGVTIVGGTLWRIRRKAAA